MKTEITKVQTMRDARQRQRLTQHELARLVGCSESNIAKIETGRIAEPAVWLKEAIANVLGIKSWEVCAQGPIAALRKESLS